ncbi:NADP oxidoreductase [Solemya velum gill symbiont]|uniref:2Fe-2S iron-sulfur cluster-binding protein n=2 Tax=Solemya velum gill symbiont TaxID=2340 RepID=UPI000997E860|nr:2Fe-2S iron-sulfur cluster-binding protein [Solemya velum gill symbiont]OOY37827.1 NADP oxidoreductase [Solemya velum gill symbiont]OOY41122.1 NADP oxidoreductase [Solemya velum gill symbiont]
MKMSFTLDGKSIPFKEGDTIMDAALNAGEYIPHLCHEPGFTPHGSCRLCLVSLDGRNISACTLPAVDGSVVESNTESINTIRRELVAMLFAEGVHICPVCEKSGSCKLQAVAYHVGLLTPRYTQFNPPGRLDASHPDMIIDFNRCILCELCVRASRDTDGKRVFSLSGRGIETSLVINSENGKLGDSLFEVTDKAAAICPVGAILPKHKGYELPIGERRYDISAIDDADLKSNRKSDE